MTDIVELDWLADECIEARNAIRREAVAMRLAISTFHHTPAPAWFGRTRRRRTDLAPLPDVLYGDDPLLHSRRGWFRT